MWAPTQPGCSRAASRRSCMMPSHSGSAPSFRVTLLMIVIMSFLLTADVSVPVCESS
jgi:hypothetical protein